jgi:hypothetical protein
MCNYDVEECARYPIECSLGGEEDSLLKYRIKPIKRSAKVSFLLLTSVLTHSRGESRNSVPSRTRILVKSEINVV